MPADRTTRDCVADALRAAVDAVWIGVQPGEREYQDAARIVSGFLRALPVSVYDANFPHDLAAAVERAAEEKR